MAFNKVYENQEKLALIYKAGLSNEFSQQQNYKDRYVIWNGIVFNTIFTWGQSGFAKSPEELAKEMTEITMPFFKESKKNNRNKHQ